MNKPLILLLMAMGGISFAQAMPTNKPIAQDDLEQSLDLHQPLQKTLQQDEFDKESLEQTAPSTNTSFDKPANNQQIADLDINDPQLVEHALYSSVVLQNIEAVAVLLPIYRQNNHQNNGNDKASRLLIKASQALLASSQDDYKTSIRLYREILSDHPSLMDIRFRLAQLLYADQQNEAAKDQFLKLRADERTLAQDKEVLDAYLTALNQKSAWSFGGSLGYAYDPNANDIPKKSQIQMNGGTWTFPKKESAKGIQYRAYVQKSVNIKDNFYLTPHATIWGKSYYSNHDYDETAIKVSLEAGIKDTKTEIGLSPYFQRRFTNKESYNQEYGLTSENAYWLTPNYQLSVSGKIGKESYEKRLKNLSSGQIYEVNLSSLWLANANRYFGAGIGYGQKDAKDPARAYHRQSAYVSWTQDWQGGLSSSATLSLTQSRYQGKDLVGIKRSDKEYGISLSLWHKNLYFLGITPRLTLSYNDTHSNHPFYEIAKSNAYIQFGKKF